MSYNLGVQPKLTDLVEIKQLSSPTVSSERSGISIQINIAEDRDAREPCCTCRSWIERNWRLLIRLVVLGTCRILVGTTPESCHRLLRLFKHRSVGRPYATDMNLWSLYHGQIAVLLLLLQAYQKHCLPNRHGSAVCHGVTPRISTAAAHCN